MSEILRKLFERFIFHAAATTSHAITPDVYCRFMLRHATPRHFAILLITEATATPRCHAVYDAVCRHYACQID